MKKHYAIRFLFWLLLPKSIFAQSVEIPDPNLRKAIRQTLELADDMLITKQNMQTLTRLTAWRANIQDLTGLEHAIDINHLSLRYNRIKDLTPITNLIKLRELMLNENPIVDLTPLTNLTNLRRLGLNGCLHITDISPLANLINLRQLFIQQTSITDFTPSQHLNLTDFEYDQPCDIPPQMPTVRERIANRSFPAIFQAWNDIVGLDHLTWEQRHVLHDLHWSSGLGTEWDITTTQPYRGLSTSLEAYLPYSQDLRDRRLAHNPNMVFIREMAIVTSNEDRLPLDSDLLLKNENGEIMRSPDGTPIVNLLNPAVQDLYIKRIIAHDQCGLLDGVLFDSIGDHGLGWKRYYPSETTEEDIIQALVHIFRTARQHVRDEFLIIINANWTKPTRFAEYINGTFMETGKDYPGGYSRPWLIELEDVLSWAEHNLREPRINCLEGEGMSIEPPDGPNNLRWMRLFTTMNLTHSDGYVLYTTGFRDLKNLGIPGYDADHDHLWHDFWDADLGHPIGVKSQLYQNLAGLFIREFTNGWAVYNRSGEEQTITLPRSSIGVSSNKQDITHSLPDLDGEIYLRVGKPFDFNGDGNINVLDLILVSQHFGTSEGDINGDGVTNILDLTLVAKQFSE